MIPHNLKDDLIRDFLDQKKSINEQLLLVDPMATSLRKPAAKHLFHNGIIVLLEIICWLIVVALVAGIFLMDNIYPFNMVNQLLHNSAVKDHIDHDGVARLGWVIKGMVALVAFLFLMMARMLASIRMKNTILNMAGKNMKLLAEQMLHRKAAMETMEQRHPLDLPSNSDSIVVNHKPHNDILL